MTRFEIVEGPIDAEVVRRRVVDADGTNGAILVFHGAVRRQTDDRQVVRLEYEAYAPMALARMEALADELTATHPISALACTHRVGVVPLGEDAMVVAVASPHRQAALDATATFITRLKQEVPIWKKEHFEGGAVWIGTPDDPQGTRAARDASPAEGGTGAP